MAARRIVITRLQKKNHRNDDSELKERESHYAPYWSREQFDHA